MARRKLFRRTRRAFATARRYARPAVRYVRTSRKQSSGMSNPLMTHALPGFLYGSVRATAKNYAQPLTSMLPFGENNDEVAFGAVGYLLAKNTQGMTRDFGRAMLTVESASLGHNIVNPMLQGFTGQSNTSAGATASGWE